MNKMKKEINKTILFNRHNFSIYTFCDNTGEMSLDGIFVSPQHTVATNKFIMIKVDNPKDDSEFPTMPNEQKPLNNFNSFILPKDKVKDILGVFKKPNRNLPILDNAVILNNKKNTIEIGTTNLESFSGVICNKIDSKYPNYKELFVESGKHIEIILDPRLLKKIADYYVKFMDEKGISKGIKIRIPVEENKVIRFFGKNKDGQNADSLIMPIKKE